ncbi:hypothetical protein CCR75_001746 [Bremia lactucae]|uniref:WRKY transcription factor 19 n=1 Tax=Bremia lactucae TaxID=4779 RepID=A0A976FRT3_BRELC|nr:hypothetical protein CCR75_001746 [Bremia lactucae]
MDEGAFVESLFAPEMRSPIATSSFSRALPSCGRVKAPCNGTFVPPPPNALVSGGMLLSHYQVPYPPPPEDAPLFVRLHDDDMFGQMLNDQDFQDFHGFKKDPEASATKSVNSLLLEPLELPRNNDMCGLKDTLSTNSAPMRSSPNGYTLDSNLMPGFPPGGHHYFASNYAPYRTQSPGTPTWLRDGSDALATQPFQKNPLPKHRILMDMAMLPHQPSPGAVDMFHPMATTLTLQSPTGLWLAKPKNTAHTFVRGRQDGPFVDALKPSGESLVSVIPVSTTESPPTSLTNKALKEFIVSTDFGTPKPKRSMVNVARKSSERVTMTEEKVSQHVNLKLSKGKKCVEANCTRRAQSNSRCKAHGGGARCQYSGPGGCIRSSQGGGFCRAHGGGKRCEFPGCPRGQQRKGRCYVHGGIRKCQYGTCEKKDRGNGFCISHGGGKRCEHFGCSRAVRRGLLCQIHEADHESGASFML